MYQYNKYVLIYVSSSLEQLILANPGPVVMTKLHDSKFVDIVGQDNIYLTVGDAVRKCNRSKKLEEP